jgi:16S rRNA (guanine966-N2)-methyltransferase
MRGLRVISGKARGRKLRDVPGETTRPITDRAKESLFNILDGDVVGASWLDLFAGTGAVGIEALSRGARFVRFVDIHRQAIDTIRANLETTGLGAGSDVFHQDAFTLLVRPADRQFDYVYIAPPQYQGLWKRAIAELDQHPGWLSEDAWIIAQIHPVEYEEFALNNLIKFDQRKYGSTLLLFYEHKSE